MLVARPISAADAVIVEVTPAANTERAATTPTTSATALGTGLEIAPSRGEIAVPHMLRRETSTSVSSSRTAPSSWLHNVQQRTVSSSSSTSGAPESSSTPPSKRMSTSGTSTTARPTT